MYVGHNEAIIGQYCALLPNFPQTRLKKQGPSSRVLPIHYWFQVDGCKAVSTFITLCIRKLNNYSNVSIVR
jgi:hypothetical protein